MKPKRTFFFQYALLRIPAGIACLIIGVIGGLLPVFPGSPFLITGIYLLLYNWLNPRIKRWIEWCFHLIQKGVKSRWFGPFLAAVILICYGILLLIYQ